MSRVRPALLLLLPLACMEAQDLAPVEPEVQTAYEEAMENLPVPLREQVGVVGIRREPDLGMSREGPLEYRLLSRAAFASIGVGDRLVTVYDAGAKGAPTWGQVAPAKEDVAKFLVGVADVLGVEVPGEGEDGKLEKAWAAFVEEVYSWSETEVPEEVPQLGDPKVLDRFLADGVWILMGGEVPPEEMIFHELGHALHLRTKPGSLRARMATWATLSGFVEVKNGKPTDGMVMSGNTTENAMVLIRLLLSDEPEKMLRGAKAFYEPSAEARFLNRYARYDLREDYAESFRMMGYYPETLAEIAPEKFLYLNALGWNARMDSKSPGPLWYSGEDFAQLVPKPKRRALFARLLGQNGKGPALHPVALAAVLRAHADVLEPADLPDPNPVIAVPDDLPVGLQRALDTAWLAVDIGGVEHVASPALQRARQDEELVSWLGDYNFYAGILKFHARTTKTLKEIYQKDIEGLGDAGDRARKYEVFREYAGSALSEKELRDLDRAEAAAQKTAGSPWNSLRYAVLAAEEGAEEGFERLEQALKTGPPGFDRVLLRGTAVDLALRSGDTKLIIEKINSIPGGTFGAWMRVRYFLKAEASAEASEQASFKTGARVEMDKCVYPMLKQLLKVTIERP